MIGTTTVATGLAASWPGWILNIVACVATSITCTFLLWYHAGPTQIPKTLITTVGSWGNSVDRVVIAADVLG